MKETTLRQFISLFSGYKDSYVVHLPPFERDSSGKNSAKKVFIAKTDFGKGDYIPLEAGDYLKHLTGSQGLAISPLFTLDEEGEESTDVCLYAIIDIDVYGVDFVFLITALRRAGYKFLPFTSKSGGLHIYFFFNKAALAKEVRKELNRIVTVFGLNKRYVDSKDVSKVEVFPQHDVRKDGILSKNIFLPYFDGKMTTMLDDDGSKVSIEQMLNRAATMLTSVNDIKGINDSLPLNDAPYCIQSVLLCGDLDSYRNEFMTTVAIYLQTKDGSGASFDSFVELNNMLNDPLDADELHTIFKSVMTHNYTLAGRCNKEPMCSHCDKKQCKLRKYGVGRDAKDNYVLNIEFGKLYKMLAEEPYYMWEVKSATDDDAVVKKIRLDDTNELMSQKAVQRACIKTLGQMMVTVKPSVWEETLNKHLAEMEDVEVSETSDTTELSSLKVFFYRYLANRRSKNNQPYTVLVKQVYFDGEKYYFRTDGLTDYLRTQRFTVRFNLREYLFKYGCEEGSIQYVVSDGNVKDIPCWIKKEDEQLRTIRASFEDILEADENIIKQNKLNKNDEENNQILIDDIRF